MGEFFKGWRRKTGLVTLAMACVLMVAWMRSLLVEDLVLQVGQSQTYFTSGNGSIQWDQITHTSGQPISDGDAPLRWEIRRLPDHDGVTLPIKEDRVQWRREGLGFRIVVAEYPLYPKHSEWTEFQMRRGRWAVSYSSVTIPLTLLSAWLILIKPRKAKETPQISTHVWVRTANRTATSEMFSR